MELLKLTELDTVTVKLNASDAAKIGVIKIQLFCHETDMGT